MKASIDIEFEDHETEEAQTLCGNAKEALDDLARALRIRKLDSILAEKEKVDAIMAELTAEFESRIAPGTVLENLLRPLSEDAIRGIEAANDTPEMKAKREALLEQGKREREAAGSWNPGPRGSYR